MTLQKLITPVHTETHEILANARAAWQVGEITNEDYNQIILSCFKAEAERECWKERINDERRTLPSEILRTDDTGVC